MRRRPGRAPRCPVGRSGQRGRSPHGVGTRHRPKIRTPVASCPAPRPQSWSPPVAESPDTMACAMIGWLQGALSECPCAPAPEPAAHPAPSLAQMAPTARRHESLAAERRAIIVALEDFCFKRSIPPHNPFLPIDGRVNDVLPAFMALMNDGGSRMGTLAAGGQRASPAQVAGGECSQQRKSGLGFPPRGDVRAFAEAAVECGLAVRSAHAAGRRVPSRLCHSSPPALFGVAPRDRSPCSGEAPEPLGSLACCAVV